MGSLAVQNPLLYQVNTRIVLFERGKELGRPAILDDITDQWLDAVVKLGFQWVWFLGVWQMSPVGRAVSLSRTDLQKAYSDGLPDVTKEDVAGSPYSIKSYVVTEDFGGDEALARLRQRLHQRNLKLLLDFVPNHISIDHPWTDNHPDYIMQGTKKDLQKEPQNYISIRTTNGEGVFAHGRDPNFDGWSDTLQINYRNPAACIAMEEELVGIARRCDGVRCDMAMLLLPDVFQRTWGNRGLGPGSITLFKKSFWAGAIKKARKQNQNFTFIAEVYWDLEYTLQQEGFDFTYDKRLYDRLLAGTARPVREHLMAEPKFMSKCLHFLENHDEERAAAAFEEKVKPAAIVSYLVPGMRFFYEGQLEGRRAKVAIQLRRRPNEPVNEDIQFFYHRLFDCLKRPEVSEGKWRLWTLGSVSPADSSWDQFIVFSWNDLQGRILLAVVNYGPKTGRCFIKLELPALEGKGYILTDLLSDMHREVTGNDLAKAGVFFSVPAWGYHLFDMTERSDERPGL
jgi:glycosidase